jgi:hypothetical protein
MPGFLGKKFPAPVGMSIAHCGDSRIGDWNKLLTKLHSPPYVAFLRLRYVEQLEIELARSAPKKKELGL